MYPMLTLVPRETYFANASCPLGPVMWTLSLLHAARDTRRPAAPADKNQLRVITNPQGEQTSVPEGGGLIISDITERRATPEFGCCDRAHRAWEAEAGRCLEHSEGCQCEVMRRR